MGSYVPDIAEVKTRSLYPREGFGIAVVLPNHGKDEIHFVKEVIPVLLRNYYTVDLYITLCKRMGYGQTEGSIPKRGVPTWELNSFWEAPENNINFCPACILRLLAMSNE